MKKILLIFMMLIIAAANGWAQNGEIIYHDNITPNEMHADHPWPENIRLFDFDEDSNPDFFLAWCEYREWHLIGYSYDNWWFTGGMMEVGDTISMAPYWFPAPEDPERDIIIELQPGFSRDSIIVGYRNQVSDDEFYYGWIRFSLDAGPEKNFEQASDDRIPWAHGVCTFIDYAYCTKPNYPLRAGQTSFAWDVLKDNTSTSHTTIYPNPTSSMVTVTGENLRQAEVLNMLGQQVLSVKVEGNELHINMAALPAGVYFVTVADEEGRRCVQKVVKE